MRRLAVWATLGHSGFMDKRRKPISPTRVFVHSRQGLGATRMKAAFEAGTAHNPRPYGFESAEHEGYVLDFSEDCPETWLQGRVFYYLGFDFIHGFRNLSRLRRADIAWTVLEWEWLSLSLLQKLRLAPRVPIIANSVWMMNNWSNWGRRYRLVWHWLMSSNVYLTMHSAAAAERARVMLPDKRFQVVPFGISSRAFPVQPPNRWAARNRPVRVYSIGDDRTRDWQTLLAAFGNDARFEIRLICRWIDDVVNVEQYRNLTVLRTLSIFAQQENYRWADVVVMPMLENVFSGITVVCEAAAMGVPVVSSATGGVPTYFNNDEVLYVPPCDPEALRSAVLGSSPEDWERLASAASTRFKTSDYSQGGMVARYERITVALLTQREIPSSNVRH